MLDTTLDDQRCRTRLSSFWNAVSLQPLVEGRLERRCQFNAYESEHNFEDVRDEDCVMHIGIGPVTGFDLLLTIKGRSLGIMIADALTFTSLHQ